VTPAPRPDEANFLYALRERIEDAGWTPRPTFEDFVADPLSSWVESAFGLTEEPGSGRLVRATPRPITGGEGAAAELAQLAARRSPLFPASRPLPGRRLISASGEEERRPGQ
jgi:hypothetical protein